MVTLYFKCTADALQANSKALKAEANFDYIII